MNFCLLTVRRDRCSRWWAPNAIAPVTDITSPRFWLEHNRTWSNTSTNVSCLLIEIVNGGGAWWRSQGAWLSLVAMATNSLFSSTVDCLRKGNKICTGSIPGSGARARFFSPFFLIILSYFYCVGVEFQDGSEWTVNLKQPACLPTRVIINYFSILLFISFPA